VKSISPEGLTIISPILLEYLHIGYFLSFLGVIESLPIL
jgi:hypothetical protein